MSQGKGFVDIVDHFFVGTHMAKIKVYQNTKNDTPQDIRPDYEGIYPFHAMMRHGVLFSANSIGLWSTRLSNDRFHVFFQNVSG